MTHRFDRGDYFEDTSEQSVDGVVVLTRGNIGYDGYRVAEKDTESGRWHRYWIKDSHLHEEVDVTGTLVPGKTLSEEELEAVESRVAETDSELQGAPEGVDADDLPQRSVVTDGRPPGSFTDYSEYVDAIGDGTSRGA